MQTGGLGLAVGSVAGCADWPRFANVSEIDVVPHQSVFTFRNGSDLEGLLTERPCDAASLAGQPFAGLGDWFDAVEFQGILEPHGRIGVRTLSSPDEVDVSCGSDIIPACSGTSGLPLRYTGDVDWMGLDVQARPLCVAYRFTNAACDPGACQWDMPLLQYSEAQACTTGSFVGPADGNSQTLPALVGSEGTVFLSLPSDHPDAPSLGHVPDPGLHAMYVAGAQQDQDAGSTDYRIAVAHVPTAEACASLLDAFPVSGDGS